MKENKKQNKKWRKDRKRALALFNKAFKKRKKLLIKLAKKFQCWDYGYMEDIIFLMIKIFQQFYINPKNLMMDTQCKTNKYSQITSSLDKCVSLIAKLNDLDFEIDATKEYAIRNEIYHTMGENIMLWWD